MDFGAPLRGQIETKPIKKRSQFLIRFLKALFMESGPILNVFYFNFREFFRVSFRTCRFLDFEGLLMRLSYFSRVQTLKIRSTINEKTSSESGSAFCPLFDRFGLDFDLQFGAVWPPRAFQKRVQPQTSKTSRKIAENIFFAGVSLSPPYRL